MTLLKKANKVVLILMSTGAFFYCYLLIGTLQNVGEDDQQGYY